MQPQGSLVFNPNYLGNIVNQINGIADDVNAINPCAQIQAIVNEVMLEVQTEINAIESQITALNLLIVMPTNLGEVINWIRRFMAPSIQAALNYIQQLGQLVTALNSLVAAVHAAANRLTSCSISIAPPTISVALPGITFVG